MQHFFFFFATIIDSVSLTCFILCFVQSFVRIRIKIELKTSRKTYFHLNQQIDTTIGFSFYVLDVFVCVLVGSFSFSLVRNFTFKHVSLLIFPQTFLCVHLILIISFHRFVVSSQQQIHKQVCCPLRSNARALSPLQPRCARACFDFALSLLFSPLSRFARCLSLRLICECEWSCVRFLDVVVNIGSVLRAHALSSFRLRSVSGLFVLLWRKGHFYWFCFSYLLSS